MRHDEQPAAADLNRISVVGNTGSGKSTLAARLADAMGCEHIELDAMYHQADWEPLPRDEMRSQLARKLEAGRWVVDGNYTNLVQDMVWAQADAVVWLDLPRWRVMPALARRTLGRMLLRRELWNGNRERLRSLFTADRQENILLWSWTRHRHVRTTMEEKMADHRWETLRFIRLSSRREIEELVDSLR